MLRPTRPEGTTQDYRLPADRALELQVGQFPALCLVQLSKEIDLETLPVRQPVGRWWDKAWRLGRPSPTWRKLALGERGVSARVTHITYSTLSNIFIILPVFLSVSTLNTAMVTV